MTPEKVMCLVGCLMATFSFVVAVVALRKMSALKKELEEDYWTKDVIGKTINAKTGKDPKADERMQAKVLNGEAEEIVTKGVKEFCTLLEKNIDNEPISCCNPRASQLGFSYMENQKCYVTLHLSLLQEQQDALPIKYEKNVEAHLFIEKLIDHYKGKKASKCTCGPGDGCNFCGGKD